MTVTPALGRMIVARWHPRAQGGGRPPPALPAGVTDRHAPVLAGPHPRGFRSERSAAQVRGQARRLTPRQGDRTPHPLDVLAPLPFALRDGLVGEEGRDPLGEGPVAHRPHAADQPGDAVGREPLGDLAPVIDDEVERGRPVVAVGEGLTQQVGGILRADGARERELEGAPQAAAVSEPRQRQQRAHAAPSSPSSAAAWSRTPRSDRVRSSSSGRGSAPSSARDGPTSVATRVCRAWRASPSTRRSSWPSPATIRSHTDRSVSSAKRWTVSTKPDAEVVPASTDAQASSTSVYRSSGVNWSRRSSSAASNGSA